MAKKLKDIPPKNKERENLFFKGLPKNLVTRFKAEAKKRDYKNNQFFIKMCEQYFR